MRTARYEWRLGSVTRRRCASCMSSRLICRPRGMADPSTAVHALCHALASREHDVHVYTTNVDGPNISAVPTGTAVDIEGVKVWYFPTAAGRHIFRSPDMRRALAANVVGFDVLHLHSVFLWTTFAAAESRMELASPMCWRLMACLFPTSSGARGPIAKSLWIYFFERRNVGDAATIQVTSEIEGGELAKLRMPTRRIVVVPNGVDLPSEMPAVDPIHSCASTPGRTSLALGAFVGRKGLTGWSGR